MRELAALGKLGQLMTVGEACDRYQKEVSKWAPTVQARRQQDLCMQELVTYYGEDTPLMAISPDTVSAAASAKAEAPCVKWKMVDGELLPMPMDRFPTPGTVNRQVIQPMRRLLRRAKKQWKIPLDLEQFQWGGQDGVLLDEPEDRVREISPAEELAFWPKLDADYHLLVELYIISGKRQSNWVMLPKSKVDLAARTVSLRILKKRRAGEKKIELTEREFEIVQAAYNEAPSCPYLFTATSGRKRDKGVRRPITARMLYNHVKAAFEAAGIKDIRPHDFRHTFASRALRGDPNLQTLMHNLDHSSMSSTLRYAHVLQEHKTRMRATVSVTKEAPANVRVLKRGSVQ